MTTKSVLGGDYSLDERSDDQLVELARLGGSRTGAWDELFRRHVDGARTVARQMLRSRRDVDDVVNEAFGGVIAAIGRGDGPQTNFRGYLLSSVRNQCRQRSQRMAVWRDSTNEDVEQFGVAAPVALVFELLSPDWQRLLWLTAVDGRSADEVARGLGRRTNAVRKSVQRARSAVEEAGFADVDAAIRSLAVPVPVPVSAPTAEGGSPAKVATSARTPPRLRFTHPVAW